MYLVVWLSEYRTESRRWSRQWWWWCDDLNAELSHADEVDNGDGGVMIWMLN